MVKDSTLCHLLHALFFSFERVKHCIEKKHMEKSSSKNVRLCRLLPYEGFETH